MLDVFLQQCTTLGVDHSVHVDQLHAAYTDWLGETARPPSRNALATALQRHGVLQVRRDDGRHFVGIQLLTHKPSDGLPSEDRMVKPNLPLVTGCDGFPKKSLRASACGEVLQPAPNPSHPSLHEGGTP